MRLRPDYEKIRRLEIALGFREPPAFDPRPGAIWTVSDPSEVVLFNQTQVVSPAFTEPVWLTSAESPVGASLPASEPPQGS